MYILKKKSDDELKAILDEIVNRVLSAKNLKVDKIILYGSYARGDADAESDIDIMILCDNSIEEIEAERSEITKTGSELCLKNDVEISLIYKDNDTFNKWIDALPFYQSVRNEGVRLYG